MYKVKTYSIILSQYGGHNLQCMVHLIPIVKHCAAQHRKQNGNKY